MTITRRHVLAGSNCHPRYHRCSAPQFGCDPHHQDLAPVSRRHEIEGDFRDRLCRMFAAEIEKRTNGALDAQVYPNSSLMKTVAQFSALRKGALDLCLYPISYAGGEFAETQHRPDAGTGQLLQAGRRLEERGGRQEIRLRSSREKGVIIVSWIWQAGGVASRATPIVNPEDAKGMKVRGGSREMDMVLQAAGATTLSTPSNELYAAMQTGACDAAITSSTSLISFRLEEVAKASPPAAASPTGSCSSR